jgi:hypothetical protein
VLEYDAAGREIARKAVPPRPLGSTPYTHALFGLGTPIMEAPMLRWANRQLRTEERSANGRETTVLLYLLNECEQYFIPGMSRLRDAPSGLVAGYIGLILLSAVVGALVCFLLARRHAFSVPGRVGWALCGFLFGWAGLLLMLSVQEWPARIVCPKCRKFRVVTRDRCEHCGAPHAMPAADGTEIFEEAAPLRRPDSVLNSSIPTAATQVTPYL